MVRAPHLHPKIPAHAEANFGAALAILAAAAEASAAVVPHAEIAALARALPAVLLGERTPIWRLLAWLRALNPSVTKIGRARASVARRAHKSPLADSGSTWW